MKKESILSSLIEITGRMNTIWAEKKGKGAVLVVRIKMIHKAYHSISETARCTQPVSDNDKACITLMTARRWLSRRVFTARRNRGCEMYCRGGTRDTLIIGGVVHIQECR